LYQVAESGFGLGAQVTSGAFLSAKSWGLNGVLNIFTTEYNLMK